MPCSLLAEQALAALEDLLEHRRASATELLITRSTSAVAVCCSSASRQLGGALLDLALEAGIRLPQLRAHLVELLGQAFELVAGADLDALVELAGADPRGAFLQRADRPHQRAREEKARGDRDQQAADQQQRGRAQDRA